MKWYTVKDLLPAYSLSKWQLQEMCRNGELGAMKFREERWKKGGYHYVIPECELSKLSAYKIGEPLYKAAHQPSEYLLPNNRAEEVMRIEEMVGDYEEYIHSPEWRELRVQALKRDKYTCQMCGTGKNVQVHHVNYKNLGTAQELEDVVTLCDDCHSKVHVKDKAKEATDGKGKNN